MLETTPSRVDEMPVPREPDEVIDPQGPDEIRPHDPTEEGLPDDEQGPDRTKDEQQLAFARSLRVRADRRNDRFGPGLVRAMLGIA
jgi:hypothetical protein